MQFALVWILIVVVSSPPASSMLHGQETSHGSASGSRDWSGEISPLLKRWIDPATPGFSIAVVKDGEIVFKGGYGLANLDHAIPNTPDTVYRIASVSKHITATCMLFLEDEGLLTLDSDIRTWLTELPDYGETITIRHLLHHTSGLRDYTSLMPLLGIDGESTFPIEETIALLARQKHLNSKPGERFSYNNSGYFLCSVICERASGKTLRQYADDKIFQPLNMASSHFHDDHREVTPRRATGYRPAKGSGYEMNETGLDQVGDGGVFTSVEEMAIWTTALLNDKIGQSTLQRLLSTFTLNDGETIRYRLGLVEHDWRGQRVLEHGGAWVGFRSFLMMFPEQDLSLIFFSNCSNYNPRRIVRDIAARVAEGLEEPTESTPRRSRQEAGEGTPAPASAPIGEWAPEEWVGEYYSPELDRTWRLLLKGENLFVAATKGEEFHLTMKKKDVLSGPWWLVLRLHHNADGVATAFELKTEGPNGFRFDRQ